MVSLIFSTNKQPISSFPGENLSFCILLKMHPDLMNSPRKKHAGLHKFMFIFEETCISSIYHSLSIGKGCPYYWISPTLSKHYFKTPSNCLSMLHLDLAIHLTRFTLALVPAFGSLKTHLLMVCSFR